MTLLLVLFNGLWQGALIATAAYGVSRVLSPRDAATRYAIWLTTLIAIVIVPVVTTLLPDPFALRAFAASGLSVAHVTLTLLALPAQPASAVSHFAFVASWLLAAWAMGATFNLFRLIRGSATMAAIARNARPSELAYAPDVLTSDEIDVPLLAGITAPRILIPSGLCQSLDARDLERIIAHERAHVRRNDPWFNLFVRIVEAVLFFNPAIHFVARRLAEEREAACDDIAVAREGQSFGYALCLAAIAQMRPQRVEVIAPNALGFRTSLLARIERLDSNHARITSIDRKAFGGTVMLFAVIAIALQAITPALALTTAAADGSSARPSLVAASCAQPNVDAAVRTPQAPEIPHGLNVTGSAQAIITIAPDGQVAAARILHSSGNHAIDAAVLAAARASTYRPKMVDCVAVRGTYVFRADFKP